MKTLSIVHVIDMLNTGGAERVLITLANLQHQHGHKVKVITTVKEGPLKDQLQEGVNFFCLNRHRKWDPFIMHQLVKQVKGYDVINVHSSHNLRYLFVSARLYNLDTPVFFHEHYGNVVNEPLKWYQEFIMPKVNVIAVSKSIEQWALDKLELSRSKVFLLPNTVLKEIPVNIVRNNDAVQLVIISNFLPNKNIEFAVNILEKLCSDGQQSFHLTIIGKLADEVYYQNIISLIKDKNLDDKVTIITDCNSVQKILSSFDIGLHTAFSESGPLALIEFLAQSIPFVANSTGEVAAQVNNDLPECFVNSFNMEEWISKIEYLLSADKSALRSKLDIVFEKYFSAETYYTNCISIYDAGLLNADS